MLAIIEHDSCMIRAVLSDAPTPSPGTRSGDSTVTGDRGGFSLEATDTTQRMFCDDVLGFPEALAAAYDAAAALPSRLQIVAPSITMADWLARWAEDVEQVRRTMMIRRRSDGTKIMTVVTLASYGTGTETSLAVESVTVPWRRGGVARSGVHPKATTSGS